MRTENFKCIRNAILLIIASAGTVYGQQPPQVSEPIKWTEPVPAQVVGDIPPGWEIVELKDQKITHGPFVLPDGQSVTLTTPKYVLQPILDSEHAALYLLEPGFNAKDNSGNPRAGTLSNLLYVEMEALRVSSENLRPLMAQIAKVQEYVQQQPGSASAPLPGLNAGSQHIEEQPRDIPPGGSAAPTPIPSGTPAPSPSTNPPPASESKPSPSPSPNATPAHSRRSKKLKKTSPSKTASPESTPTPTPTPKKRWF
jgi:hypothetical protein